MKSGKMKAAHLRRVLFLAMAGVISLLACKSKSTGGHPYFGEVFGHVLDSNTGTPIESALILVDDTLTTTDTFWTDSTGYYHAILSLGKEQQIFCLKGGFATKSTSVSLGVNKPVADTIDFDLVPME